MGPVSIQNWVWKENGNDIESAIFVSLKMRFPGIEIEMAIPISIRLITVTTKIGIRNTLGNLPLSILVLKRVTLL